MSDAWLETIESNRVEHPVETHGPKGLSGRPCGSLTPAQLKLALAHFLEEVLRAFTLLQTSFVDGIVREIDVVLLAETLAR